MKVAVISERWEENPDEGMLVYLEQLVQYLRLEHELLVIHERGVAPSEYPSTRVTLGKLLTRGGLPAVLDTFGPELILYCPSACATVGALIRHRRLEACTPIPAALLTLQSRSYPPWLRWALRWLRPCRLVVLSRGASEEYRRLGFSVVESRVGVDLGSFRPVESQDRERLRIRHGLPVSGKLALHVGHLAAYRNLERLEDLARDGGWKVVMVASTANPAHDGLRRRLERAGVIVRHEYQPRIEEYYQASDLYVFPVSHGSGAIEFPLSVLEAMACDLPVLTTPFGALPECFGEQPGFHYLRDDDDLVLVAAALLASPVETRSMVRDYTWGEVMHSMFEELVEGMSG